MTLTAVASFPIEAPFVPRFLEKIIDKKVCHVALNALEEFVDWLFSWIYLPYRTLYTAKMGRIHTFRDQSVKLYDCTNHAIASICKEGSHDSIYLGDKELKFNCMAPLVPSFTQKANIEYLVIKNVPKTNNYQVTFYSPPDIGHKRSMSVAWTVSTNISEKPNQLDFVANPEK